VCSGHNIHISYTFHSLLRQMAAQKQEIHSSRNEKYTQIQKKKILKEKQ